MSGAATAAVRRGLDQTFHSLAIPNYRRYAAGALVSNVGTWMQRIAQDWLVLVLTAGSGTALGITTGLQMLPALLLSPLAGVVADRFPKRTVLSVTQVAMAVPAALLGVLAISGAAQPWHVYVLALVFGVATAFDAPARQSFVVEMVGKDDLANAVGLNSASFNSGRMLGPALAGLLIGALGSGAQATGWVILLNALSYLAVLASLRTLDPTRLRPSEPTARGHGVREGMRYVRARPDLVLVLTIVFFVGTFGMNFQLTSALMATEVFGKGATDYGVLGSVMAIGSLAGALLAARRPRPRQRLVVGAALAFSVMVMVSGLMPTYLSYAVVLPLVGFTALTLITSANATIQLSVEPQMRGRVSALYLMIFLGGTPLGSPLVGWFADVAGPRSALVLCGAITLVGVVVATLVFTRRTGLVVRPALHADRGLRVRTRDEVAAELRDTAERSST